MKLNIRQAAPGDFSGLYDLWEDAGLKLYPYREEKDRFIAMVNLNPKLCFILVDGKGGIFGSILGAFDGRTGSVHRLAIKAELKKKGYGSLLLKKLEDKFRKLKVKKISAQIHVSNTQVAKFYKKYGYKNMNYVISVYKDLA